jgi:NitT/TauT family transport system substrate-binding protein
MLTRYRLPPAAASLLGLLLAMGALPSAAAPSATLKVRMGYFANLTHAQALIGVSRGDFRKALGAATLETTVFNAGPSVVEAFLARQLDCSFIGPAPAVNGYAKSNGGLRVVCGVAANGVVIVAHPQAGITHLADLAGKRIATPQFGNTQDVSARWYLTQTLKVQLGEGPGQTRIIPIANAEQLELFRRHEIDASWAPEPWASRMLREAGGVAVAQEKDLWEQGRFATTVFIVSSDFLAQHPREVEALVASIRDITTWVNANRGEAALLVNRELAALSGKPLPDSVLADAFKRVEFTTDPLAASVVAFAQRSVATGMLRQAPDLSGLFDTTIVARLRR